MSDQEKPYSPTSDLVDALARPLLDDSKQPASADSVAAEPVPVLAPQEITLDSENTKIAVEHIKDTLLTLKDLLDDLKQLAPASQQGFFFQTAAIIAKTRLEGSNMLAALEGSARKGQEEKRGGARSNHLHLNVTSAQFGEFVASQVKKSKDGK